MLPVQLAMKCAYSEQGRGRLAAGQALCCREAMVLLGAEACVMPCSSVGAPVAVCVVGM